MININCFKKLISSLFKLFHFYLVAVQCLETAYDVSLANTQNESVYGPVIELLPLVTEISIATEAAQSISFTSWPHTSEQLVNIYP